MNFEGRVWSVVSGPCTIDSDDCILSPGYPENYGNNQQCKAGALSLEAVESLAGGHQSGCRGWDSRHEFQHGAELRQPLCGLPGVLGEHGAGWNQRHVFIVPCNGSL